MGVWFIGVCQKRNLGHGVVQYFVDSRHSAAVGGPSLGGVGHQSKQRVRAQPRKEKVLLAPDLFTVGGGAKKGLTSDGGVYIVFT
jgi:hypothetical protein